MLRRPMYRKVMAAIIFTGLLLVAATAASADHSWNGYHWAGDGATVSPTVADNTTAALYDVPAGVVEWASLGTRIQPTLTPGKKGNIKVTEASSPFWLGLARIFLDEEGHITKGEVKLNTSALAYYEVNGYPGIADHVLCQELGHVLGLGHNRDGVSGGSPDDSCMNDQGHLGDYTAPNSHDTDQLAAIYGHTDVVASDDDSGGGGPPCSKNPGHPNCVPQNGQWITVHVFPIP